MSRCVLHATALCALLFEEPGHEAVLEHLPDACLSTVNLTEVLTKALDKKKAFDRARAVLAGLPIRVVPFEPEQAELAAAIREETRACGLSLGDRACLALGMLRRLPVVTSDRDWSLVGLDVEVILFR